MKIEHNKQTGMDTYIPETSADNAALEYVRNHRPLFAVAESYTVSAFVAGATWASNGKGNDELRAKLKVNQLTPCTVKVEHANSLFEATVLGPECSGSWLIIYQGTKDVAEAIALALNSI